ncbi:665_t:CDS:2, partial [Racocetra persica]
YYNGANVNKTKSSRYKYPSQGCCNTFTNLTRLIEYVKEIYCSMVLGVQYQLQYIQTVHDKNNDIELFKESLLKELDDLIKDLEHNKQIYLPLIECGYDICKVFGEIKKLKNELIDNKQKIILLEEKYKKLNEEYKKFFKKYDELRKDNETLLKKIMNIL